MEGLDKVTALELLCHRHPEIPGYLADDIVRRCDHGDGLFWAWYYWAEHMAAVLSAAKRLLNVADIGTLFDDKIGNFGKESCVELIESSQLANVTEIEEKTFQIAKLEGILGENKIELGRMFEKIGFLEAQIGKLNDTNDRQSQLLSEFESRQQQIEQDCGKHLAEIANLTELNVYLLEKSQNLEGASDAKTGEIVSLTSRLMNCEKRLAKLKWRGKVRRDQDRRLKMSIRSNVGYFSKLKVELLAKADKIDQLKSALEKAESFSEQLVHSEEKLGEQLANNDVELERAIDVGEQLIGLLKTKEDDLAKLTSEMQERTVSFEAAKQAWAQEKRGLIEAVRMAIL